MSFIKIHIKEIECEAVDWIRLGLVMGFVNTVTDVLVLQKQGISELTG
jgi:hypothetical protein